MFFLYSAIDVANYVILQERLCGHLVSNLKLQKILYFIQATFLVERGMPCFFEEILAWSFGPVVYEVFYKYRIFGGSGIPSNLKIKRPRILYEDKELIDSLLETLRLYDSVTLTNVTLHQDPWVESYDNNDETISLVKIKKFFEE